MVATIHCRTAVPWRHHKLKDGLLGRPDVGLAIQEAILEEQLFLGLNIGGCSLLIVMTDNIMSDSQSGESIN